jgi:hypothetical protein
MVRIAGGSLFNGLYLDLQLEGWSSEFFALDLSIQSAVKPNFRAMRLDEN